MHLPEGRSLDPSLPHSLCVLGEDTEPDMLKAWIPAHVEVSLGKMLKPDKPNIDVECTNWIALVKTLTKWNVMSDVW